MLVNNVNANGILAPSSMCILLLTSAITHMQIGINMDI